MRNFWPFRQKRKAGLSLEKYLFLTDSQLIYQLATSPNSKPLADRLDGYHDQLGQLSIERNSAMSMYAVTFAACLLARFNLIDNFNPAGISLLPVAVKHLVIVAYAVSLVRLGLVSSKYSFICGLFHKKFYASQADARVDLLAKYPLAFDALKYYVGQIGSLPHTASMRIPKRMIMMLVILSSAIMFYLAVSFWLFGSLALDVWMSKTPVPSILSKSVVIVSIVIAFSSLLLPVDLLFKRSYMHIGLIKMMNGAHEEDRPRYDRFRAAINRIKIDN
jgi:hypothetical protein